MTKLRGVDFGPCWDAPGVRGWGGEGYWFHPIYRSLFAGFNFNGSTRVGKTTTYDLNPGNMPIAGKEERFGPIEWLPECIWASPISGRTINSVGLAGPGAEALLDAGLLEDTDRYMISFMSTKKTKEERVADLRKFVALLKRRLLSSTAFTHVGLQINISCPNTGLDPNHLVDEGVEMLDVAAELNIPIIIKLNIFAPIAAAKKIADHSACDALCQTNALPFDDVAKMVDDWNKIFPKGSPLRRRNPAMGGGGYSGPELLGLVTHWIRQARDAGIDKPINAGGGIRHPHDVEDIVRWANLQRGKDSIFFASAAMVRPWNVQPIIKRARELLG